MLEEFSNPTLLDEQVDQENFVNIMCNNYFLKITAVFLFHVSKKLQYGSSKGAFTKFINFFKCYLCGQEGHIRPECPELKKPLNERNRKTQVKINLINEYQLDSEE